MMFAQNIDCGYSLVAHNLCFGAKIRKIGIALHSGIYYTDMLCRWSLEMYLLETSLKLLWTMKAHMYICHYCMLLKFHIIMSTSIKDRFCYHGHREHVYKKLGYMLNMAAMLTNAHIFSISRTGGPIFRRLGMKHL